MLTAIGGCQGTTMEYDKMIWKHHQNGQFSENRVYKRGRAEAAGRTSGQWKSIWKSMAPTKVEMLHLVSDQKSLLDDP